MVFGYMYLWPVSIELLPLFLNPSEICCCIYKCWQKLLLKKNIFIVKLRPTKLRNFSEKFTLILLLKIVITIVTEKRLNPDFAFNTT